TAKMASKSTGEQRAPRAVRWGMAAWRRRALAAEQPFGAGDGERTCFGRAEVRSIDHHRIIGRAQGRRGPGPVPLVPAAQVRLDILQAQTLSAGLHLLPPPQGTGLDAGGDEQLNRR